MVSSTLAEPLPWPNSTLLTGDVTEAVANLKRERPEASFSITGSRTLIHALMGRNLIDEWLLMIHPLVSGSGLRLFDDESPSIRLTLVDSLITSAGAVIATYRTAWRSENG